MPETPEQFHARVSEALRMPPVQDWKTFPFDGEMRPRKLAPPTVQDPPRQGIDGVDCFSCTAPDEKYIWTNKNWRLSAPPKPTGLPVVVLLHPREHHADPGDLPDSLAQDMGLMLARVEAAVRSVGEIGRVHVCRWGDGSEHLHWWFIARPTRVPQLLGSFAAVWDEVLPPTPDDVWNANLEAVVRTLG
ncbi:MAG: hypothetical protein ABIS18_11690 [Actinomycetota bacterium]